MKSKIAFAIRLLTGSFTPFSVPFWGKEEDELVSDWLKGAQFPDAERQLEKAILTQLGEEWVVRLLNSGRMAIQLALESLRLPLRSEVLLPSFSCTGVVMPIIQAGLCPVLVDVDEQFNIRFESVLEANSPRVRAVILPHLAGHWSRDTEKIIEWARSSGVVVVEDVAQSFGLKKNNKFAGTFGDLGVFSSGMGKPIFGPGGGWVVCRNSNFGRFLKSREISQEPRGEVHKRLSDFVIRFSVLGGKRGRGILKSMIASRFTNSPPVVETARPFEGYGFSAYSISDIEAQLALLQIKKIDLIIQRRREFAARWQNLLNHLALPTMQIPLEQDNTFSKMLISFKGEAGQAESRKFRENLWFHGIETESFYTPLHYRPPFKALRRTSMPITESLWRSAYALPVRPNLDANDWKRIQKALSTIKTIQ